MRTAWRGSGRGFTLLEVCAVAVVVGLLVVLLVPVMARQRGGSRWMRDSTALRGVQQGLVVWGQTNGGRALPSDVDRNNATVALGAGESPRVKDTTGNIFSMLVYQGVISPELCVSAAEVNPSIREYNGFRYSLGAGALWDPGFNADFTRAGRPGNVSFGLAPADDARRENLGGAADAGCAVVGNRGPEVTDVGKTGAGGASPGNGGEVAVRTKIPNSNTLLIHGGRRTWEGNIVYGDGHVEFETQTAPQRLGYWNGAGWWRDCIFFDEPDDATPGRPGANVFLGIFTNAGALRGDWKAVWD